MKKTLLLILILSLTLVGIGFSSPLAYAKKYGEFVKTGKINQPRFKHESILLDDGRVLVLGGEFGFPYVRALNHAEVYHPDTGKFEVISPMNYRRVGFTTTKLADGKILIIGGKGGPQPWVHVDFRKTDYSATQKLAKDRLLNAVELFNPKTNTFQKLENFPYPVIDHVAVTTPQGDVFILGGYDGSNIHKEVYRFNPEILTFSKYMEMSVSRRAHGGIAIDNQRIFVAGGQTLDYDLSTCPSRTPACNNILYDEILNLESKKTTRVQDPERSEHWMGLTDPKLFLVLDKKILVGNLFDPENGSYQQNFDESSYKGVARKTKQKWIRESIMPTVSRVLGKAVTLLKDDVILHTGGDNPVYYELNPHVATISDLRKRKYKIVGTLKYRRYYHSATRLKNGNVILIGGYGGYSRFSSSTYMEAITRVVMTAEIFEVN